MESDGLTRAAVIEAFGADPRSGYAAVPTPRPDETLIAVDVGAINPVDVAISRGEFYAGSPKPPYVLGQEAVGRVVASDVFPAGTTVWGVRRHSSDSPGTLGELTVFKSEDAVPLPEGMAAYAAATIGMAGLTAWSALVRAARVDGERVAILGASGMVGLAAVQIARSLGAGRVVAVGRNPERLNLAQELGADSIVALEDLIARRGSWRVLSKAKPTLIVDLLWGEPLVSAIETAARGARILQIGQAADPTSEIPSSLVRGRQLSIVGYALLANPPAERACDLRDVLTLAQRGGLRLPAESMPLRDVGKAWARMQQEPRVRVLVQPNDEVD